MSIVEIKVPQLSESITEATMLTWKKQVGESVIADEILIEIETDKVVLEVPAPANGVLVEILQTDGAIVGSEQLIAKVDTTINASATSQQINNSNNQNQFSASNLTNLDNSNIPNNNFVMPAANKLLAENNLTAEQFSGTGKDGRITKGDVLSALNSGFIKSNQQNFQQVNTPSTINLPIITKTIQSFDKSKRLEERVPMSRLRARVANRLLESQSTNAILTTFNEVNMSAIIKLRKEFQEDFVKEHGVKLGFMAFFVKAVVQALKKFPILNASVDGNDIIYHGYFDIGVAVGSPRGLVVPIIRDADNLSFAEIEKKITDFGQKAQNGKLSIEEMSGGTFSISNGGTFGSMMSTPIINPPQSAILGIHATKERPIVENGEIVIAPMNYFAMSYDHRIIDGREAVLGLVLIKEALENPTRLLFNL